MPGGTARTCRRPALPGLIALAAAAWIAGCGRRAHSPPPGAVAQQPVRAPAAPPPARAARPKIVVLGDSLTAGLGLPPEEAYPTLLQQRLDAGGFNYDVVNAGVSGDT